MRLRQFVKEHRIRVLNVAGSRERNEPGLHDVGVSLLEEEAVFGSG